MAKPVEPGQPAHRTREAHELRRIAVEAEVAQRTVERYFGGLPVRGLSKLRIERTLRTLRGADDNE